MADIRRQELWCHACSRYVQFSIDLELDGNHVLECPNCGHEHCRVVKDGEITGIRWAQRNGPTIHVTSGTTTSSTSIYVSCGTTATGGSATFFQSAWADSAGVS